MSPAPPPDGPAGRDLPGGDAGSWEASAQWWQAEFTGGADVEYTEQILPLIEARLAGARRVLDVGTGEGQAARLLAATGSAVVGIDPTVAQITEARRRAGGPVYARAAAAALPFPDSSFDGVLACLVFEHIDDLEGAVAEVARVLRPGGVFCFTVPAFMALWRYHDEAYGHFRRYRRADFARRVREAGLEVAACRFFKCAFFPPLLLLALLERRGWIPRRDNFFAVPGWLNRALTAQILWEDRAGLGRLLPFGVSLLCAGRRAA